MIDKLFNNIISHLEQYESIDIEEAKNKIIIISNYSKIHNIHIDYRKSINNIWISSVKYGAFQFHLEQDRWINKENQQFQDVLSDILQQEIKNLNVENFIKAIT